MSFILLGILNSQAAVLLPGFPLPGVEPDLWLDASDASTISESGGSVSQWDNKGTLENFTQATSADQPTTGVSTQNGLNVIDFASDFLAGATKAQWKFLHDGTTYFIAGVVKLNSVAVLNGILGTNQGGSSSIGLGHWSDNRESPNSSEWQVSNGSSGNTPIQVFDGGGFSQSTFLITSAILDPDNATPADRIDYYIDNVQGSTTNTESNTPSSSDPTTNLDIGAVGGGAFPMDGSIAELIIVSGADATESNRQEVVTYLNDKWSIF